MARQGEWRKTVGQPSYLELYHTGELSRRIARAQEILRECHLCPRECLAHRWENKTGECGTGRWAVVASFQPHFGEEAPLVGRYGSGTIFISHCNLHCQFCQNFELSQLGEGREVRAEELAAMMAALQRRGCHNINIVSPTHVVPQVLEALPVAIEHGLSIPLVYNTGGYDLVETLRLLEDIVDIYMPDMKYADEAIAREFSRIKDYPAVNQAAVKEMQRQVGDLVSDEEGIAQRGLLVRHLILPHGLAGSEKVMKFLAEEVSRDCYVNLMEQYRPCYRAHQYSQLSRPVTQEEYRAAVQAAMKYGLWRFDEPERCFSLVRRKQDRNDKAL